MIISIGVDIVEITEIEKSISMSKRFIERVFTEKERIYCESQEDKYQHYAVRFAAKEAVMKALGTGWNNGIQWKQIEVNNNKDGKPKLILGGKAKALAKNMNVDNVFVSLSHSQKNAIANVIFEGYTDEELRF